MEFKEIDGLKHKIPVKKTKKNQSEEYNKHHLILYSLSSIKNTNLLPLDEQIEEAEEESTSETPKLVDCKIIKLEIFRNFRTKG